MWRLTEGETQKDSPSLVMVQVQAQRLVCRKIRIPRLMCDGQVRKDELGRFHADKKILVGSHMGDRTANRHR